MWPNLHFRRHPLFRVLDARPSVCHRLRDSYELAMTASIYNQPRTMRLSSATVRARFTRCEPPKSVAVVAQCTRSLQWPSHKSCRWHARSCHRVIWTAGPPHSCVDQWPGGRVYCEVTPRDARQQRSVSPECIVTDRTQQRELCNETGCKRY